MRKIFLDTEKTGIDPRQGHRIIEVAGVEMVNRRLTGKHFHHYLNPDRDIDAGAQEVHGISREFLQDKPRFKDIARDLLDYIADAVLVIHNAPFDIGFLNSELGLLDQGRVEDYCASVVDTLKMAKELHPGKRNNLDALCERYQVNNAGRTLHGALLDSDLLAEVFLAMTRGQETLDIDIGGGWGGGSGVFTVVNRGDLLVQRATEAESAAHAAYLDDVDKASSGNCVWKSLE